MASQEYDGGTFVTILKSYTGLTRGAGARAFRILKQFDLPEQRPSTGIDSFCLSPSPSAWYDFASGA